VLWPVPVPYASYKGGGGSCGGHITPV